MLPPENNRTEYKECLTDGLEKEIVAFLNSKEGGEIYIGVRKNGTVIGVNNCDELQLKIKDRLINNISPNILGLIDIACKQFDDKFVLRISVSVGSLKPYYIKSKGMSESGCFVRIGSSAQPMNQANIDLLYATRTHYSISVMRSPRQDLTFKQLLTYYAAKNITLNENFARTLEFYTPDGEYNYVAYLCADNNSLSVRFGKYDTLERLNLVENYEYGMCCILLAADRVLEKLLVENRIFTRVTARKRIEVPTYNMDAVREAVINAFVHTNYFYENPPKFELFPDRLEITSTGSLPEGLPKEDFFTGISLPRNRELMRIFKDVKLVEHLGQGIPRILQQYPSRIFSFMGNFIRVTFPFEKDETAENLANKEKELDKKLAVTAKEKSSPESSPESSPKSSPQIIKIISENAYATIDEMSGILGISRRAILKQLAKLKEKSLIRRVGPNKGGHWEIIQK